MANTASAVVIHHALAVVRAGLDCLLSINDLPAYLLADVPVGYVIKILQTYLNIKRFGDICYTGNMSCRDLLCALIGCVVLVTGCAPVPATVAPVIPADGSGNITVTRAWPRINSFSSDADSIKPGENVTLHWDTSNGDPVTITPGVGRVGPGGSVVVAPRETTRYELVAANDNGRSVGWVTVNVMTVPVLLPDLVVTDVTYNSGLLYYTVKNTGTADAGPCNTWLYDMSHMQRDQSWVSGLKPGEEKKGEFSNFQYTGNEITICADGGKDIDESNEDNNCYVPTWGFKSGYDMLQYASRASWRGTGGFAQFGEMSDPVAGTVNKVNQIVLEDGKTYRKVIEMSPPGESYSWLEGLFGESVEQWQTGSYMIPMEVPVNSRFTAKVGLARDAEGGGGVTFVFGLVGPDGKRNYWPGVKASHDGKLDSMDIDLSSYAGKKIMAILRVEAGADTLKNHAVWAEARISQ